MSYNNNHKPRLVTIYHASPRLDLGRIYPRYSPKFAKHGIFVSDSLQAMWDSWGYWAMRKPITTHSGHRTSELFSKVAFYSAKVQHSTLTLAKERHRARALECGNNYGSWGWDIETFLPEDLVPYLTPTSCKVYDKGDIVARGQGHRYPSPQEDPDLALAASLTNNPAAQLFTLIHETMVDLALRKPEHLKSVDTYRMEAVRIKDQLRDLFRTHKTSRNCWRGLVVIPHRRLATTEAFETLMAQWVELSKSLK